MCCGSSTEISKLLERVLHIERQLQVPGQCRGLGNYVSLKQMLGCFLAPNLLLFAYVQ